jgi:type III restriction enzyme
VSTRRAKQPPKQQPGLPTLDPRLSFAPVVPSLYTAVRAWARYNAYQGVTDTTRELLNHWFETDHTLWNGQPFTYHAFQREAIETLIYLWEVEQLRQQTALLERYANETDIRLPQYDDFARYAVKMATGTGKTKVMSLAVVWQYLNAAREGDPDYAKTFLIIAPNVIVYERLKTDFANGAIFRNDPLIPRHMKLFWDLDCVMRGDGERAAGDGMLFLTNIQQLYQPRTPANDEPDALTAVLGPRPPSNIDEPPRFTERIANRPGNLLVLNDEAHHTHDEDMTWNEIIRSLNDETPLAAQLDFSATPRFTSGQLFPWTVFDYPLKTAIVDRIVKRPLKGVTTAKEVPSTSPSIQYEAYLVAGVNRWREYREQLEPLGKKPILFIMLHKNAEADDVGAWLRDKYTSEFGGHKTLVIHTDNKGEISKRDLEDARRVAQNVDSPDQPVNAIVSVMMLREGWDVKNVTVIVGLRPYSANANILPEQTIGRGLRLMFGPSNTHDERVDIIGTQKFLQFIDDLERFEDIKLETFEVGRDKLQIISIYPEEARREYDIEIPQLSPILTRKNTLAEEIEALDVMAFDVPPLPVKPNSKEEETFRYEGRDIITLERIVEREYRVPEPQTPQEIIGYYARRICDDLKLTGQFALLVPKVTEFFERKAFGSGMDLNDPMVLRAMSRTATAYVVRNTFKNALSGKLIEQATPTLHMPSVALSSCPPFPYSRLTYAARKTVFNLLPCDNNFEEEFARFLDDAFDVAAFSKLPQQFGFRIEYTDAVANLRSYYPDFVARLETGEHWLIETKGAETTEVAHKDRAARLWCENASLLTGVEWRYVKVAQAEYKKLQPSDFSDVMVLAH